MRSKIGRFGRVLNGALLDLRTLRHSKKKEVAVLTDCGSGVLGKHCFYFRSRLPISVHGGKRHFIRVVKSLNSAELGCIELKFSSSDG